jgi:hypothetical protein
MRLAIPVGFAGCADDGLPPNAEDLLETVDGQRVAAETSLSVTDVSRDGRVVLISAGDWARLTYPPPRGEISAFPGEANPFIVERPSRRASLLCPAVFRARAVSPCALSEDGRYVFTCSRPVVRVDRHTCGPEGRRGGPAQPRTAGSPSRSGVWTGSVV